MRAIWQWFLLRVARAMNTIGLQNIRVPSSYVELKMLERYEDKIAEMEEIERMKLEEREWKR